MRITLGELRQIVVEIVAGSSDERQHKKFVSDLIERFPVLKKIRLTLLYATMALIRVGKQDDREGHVVSQAELAQIHAVLSGDRLASSTWHVRSLDKNEFQIARVPGTNRKEGTSQHARIVDLDLEALDAMPQTTFTRSQLYRAAKLAGHKLFDTSSSKLIWDARNVREASWEFTNTYRLAQRYAQDVGEDALDYRTFNVTDFSFVFFPSRPGVGLNAAELFHFVRDRAKMADYDGNIYLVDNIYDTAFSIIKPTLTSKRMYDAVVRQTLEKGL